MIELLLASGWQNRKVSNAVRCSIVKICTLKWPILIGHPQVQKLIRPPNGMYRVSSGVMGQSRIA
jgi:hypothetical protein